MRNRKRIIKSVKNTVLGTLLIIIGVLTVPICDNDSTAFVMCLMLGVVAVTSE